MRNGRSLAMSSANSDTKNRKRNIQSDQKPLRFDLKFCQRRRLSGEMPSPWFVAGTAAPNGDCVVVSTEGGAEGGGAVIVIRPPAPRNRSADRPTCRRDRKSG